jgi:hypothetical protein
VTARHEAIELCALAASNQDRFSPAVTRLAITPAARDLLVEVTTSCMGRIGFGRFLRLPIAEQWAEVESQLRAGHPRGML